MLHLQETVAERGSVLTRPNFEQKPVSKKASQQPSSRHSEKSTVQYGRFSDFRWWACRLQTTENLSKHSIEATVAHMCHKYRDRSSLASVFRLVYSGLLSRTTQKYRWATWQDVVAHTVQKKLVLLQALKCASDSRSPSSIQSQQSLIWSVST